jgi:hypothetical protein
VKGLRRCHEDFRVIALGVPVPPFQGRWVDEKYRKYIYIYMCIYISMYIVYISYCLALVEDSIQS